MTSGKCGVMDPADGETRRLMKLIVVHYHWRMGGVRRVVEAGLPALVRNGSLGIDGVILASGQAASARWQRKLRSAVGDAVPVRFVVEPALGYASEWGGGIERLPHEVTAAAARVLDGAGGEALVLLENPAVGRNLLVAGAFARACESAGGWLLCHHHDYFFDARWARWPEIEACGFATAGEAMAAAFPSGQRVSHFAVSARRAAVLHPGPGRPDVPGFCPNPVVIEDAAPATEWLRNRLGTDAPVWLLPCRLLRRKNVIEAVLLGRLFNAEAVLVTTGGVSSPAEEPYAAALARAATECCWPLHLSVLANAGESAPTVASLMRASEMVVLPSLFEGFGLPLYEAAALGVPALGRRDALSGGWLESVETYFELWVDRAMLDWPAELARQHRLFRAWRERLPRDVAAAVRDPWWWHPDAPVPFSRLTVTGQVDILGTCETAHEDMFGHLVDANPWLSQGWGDFGRWRRTTGVNAPWAGCQSPEGFAGVVAFYFKSMKLAAESASLDPAPCPPELTPERLAQTNHYPLLWATET
jgi:glycosyltransferase involved in cell wall biosynthesis